MPTQEWSQVWHNAQFDVGLLQALYVHHAYPRHSHDYYVICLIERGHQSFTHKGAKHFTPPGGVILINPGAMHTGEAADEQGFQMRSLYPTVSHMQTAVFELTGRHRELPFFTDVRVDHGWTRDSVLALHKALAQGAGTLECESCFTWTLAQLIKRYADLRFRHDRLITFPFCAQMREKQAKTRIPRNKLEKLFFGGALANNDWVKSRKPYSRHAAILMNIFPRASA